MEVIDSCATSNGGCDHICRHGVGGPVCSCHRGYQLQADGRSCEGRLTWKQFSPLPFSFKSFLKSVFYFHALNFSLEMFASFTYFNSGILKKPFKMFF